MKRRNFLLGTSLAIATLFLNFRDFDAQEDPQPNKTYFPQIINSEYEGTILFDGDSRTINSSYPSRAYSIGQKKNHKYINVAGNGQSYTMMEKDAKDQVDSQLIYKDNILISWAGVNDAASLVATVDSIYEHLVTYCLHRKQAGWRVIVCTEIDAQDHYRVRENFNWHESYLVLNELIRRNYMNFATELVDLGADERLKDATNLDYYRDDKVHLNSSGYAVVGDLVGPVLKSL